MTTTAVMIPAKNWKPSTCKHCGRLDALYGCPCVWPVRNPWYTKSKAS